MPTQEERLSTVEQSMAVMRRGLADIHHNETILLGVMAEQGKDIREMKVSLAALNERVGAFEQGVQERFEALEGHLGTFEQSVTTRFGEQDKKLDDLGRLLLQVLDRLPPS
jgi:septation ring formation regulator EzrA